MTFWSKWWVDRLIVSTRVNLWKKSFWAKLTTSKIDTTSTEREEHYKMKTLKKGEEVQFISKQRSSHQENRWRFLGMYGVFLESKFHKPSKTKKLKFPRLNNHQIRSLQQRIKLRSKLAKKTINIFLIESLLKASQIKDPNPIIRGQFITQMTTIWDKCILLQEFKMVNLNVFPIENKGLIFKHTKDLIEIVFIISSKNWCKLLVW